MKNYLLNIFLNALILSLRKKYRKEFQSLRSMTKISSPEFYIIYFLVDYKMSEIKGHHENFFQILTFHPNYGLKNKVQKISNSTKLEVKRSWTVSKRFAFNSVYDRNNYLLKVNSLHS